MFSVSPVFSIGLFICLTLYQETSHRAMHNSSILTQTFLQICFSLFSILGHAGNVFCSPRAQISLWRIGIIPSLGIPFHGNIFICALIADIATHKMQIHGVPVCVGHCLKCLHVFSLILQTNLLRQYHYPRLSVRKLKARETGKGYTQSHSVTWRQN